MYKPTIVLNQGKWYRFRFGYSAVNYFMNMEISESLGCEMQLLAKDGVWLTDGFREVSYLRFAAGNRVDVAVRCQTPGQGNWYTETPAP